MIHPPPLDPSVAKLHELERSLASDFVGKGELIRLLLLSLVAGEHLLLVGPPGTAKSALVRTLASGLSARYFEYLLTRFSEPNELLGPVDIAAFRQGTFRRRTELMLPEAEVVFLDEIFKASSAILNSLLGLLNEKQVLIGAERVSVPLLSLFAASNEIPSDDNLTALLDRFLLRVRTDNVPGHQFALLVQKGLTLEKQNMLSEVGRKATVPTSVAPISVGELLKLRAASVHDTTLSEECLREYKLLVSQIRGEGIFLSDRRLVKFLKLVLASALVDGRKRAEVADLFVLKHAWNTVEQAEILSELVDSVLRQHNAATPGHHRATPIEPLLREFHELQLALQQAGELSDVQLFAKLRALGELRFALMQHNTPQSQDVLKKLETLLETTVAQSPLL